jgi:stalled ribosome rescue protein Dom34
MKNDMGLWIDHRQAVIVTLNDGTESIEHVEADFEKRGNYTSDMQSESESSLRMDLAEDKHERHAAEMVNHYYDAVATHIKNATGILIMGPGPAKSEFQKYLENHKFSGTIIGVEAADNLTDAQIAAKVRTTFAKYENIH